MLLSLMPLLTVFYLQNRRMRESPRQITAIRVKSGFLTDTKSLGSSVVVLMDGFTRLWVLMSRVGNLLLRSAIILFPITEHVH